MVTENCVKQSTDRGNTNLFPTFCSPTEYEALTSGLLSISILTLNSFDRGAKIAQLYRAGLRAG
jgi:hypothetical protein